MIFADCYQVDDSTRFVPIRSGETEQMQVRPREVGGSLTDATMRPTCYLLFNIDQNTGGAPA